MRSSGREMYKRDIICNEPVIQNVDIIELDDVPGAQ